jgi:phage-related protein
MKILHYKTASGREPVKEFITELPIETRFEVLTLLRRLEAGELITMPQARSMSSMVHGLYELRVRDPQGNVRVFYYTKVQDTIFLIHGVRKKSQTISDQDRDLILKRIKEIRLKVKE